MNAPPLDLHDLLETAKAATQADWYPELVGSPGQGPEDMDYIVDSGPTFICSTQIGNDRGMHDVNHIAAFDPPTMQIILNRLIELEAQVSA